MICHCDPRLWSLRPGVADRRRRLSFRAPTRLLWHGLSRPLPLAKETAHGRLLCNPHQDLRRRLKGPRCRPRRILDYRPRRINPGGKGTPRHKPPPSLIAQLLPSNSSTRESRGTFPLSPSSSPQQSRSALVYMLSRTTRTTSLTQFPIPRYARTASSGESGIQVHATFSQASHRTSSGR